MKYELEKKGCFVVYFAADDEDINSEDVQYSDILLACTRHLLDGLKEKANSAPLLDWLRNCWDELSEFLQSDVNFDKLTLNVQLQQFAKLTANLKIEPTARKKIRETINRHTTSLIDALNQFITDGKGSLAPDCKLVLIVDNLDRIAPVPQEHGRTNHEEIFLDRCEQLKGLDCHVIYTAPISLIYSQWAMVDYFIQRAPDFFDWRSGLFRFPRETQELNQSIHQFLDESSNGIKNRNLTNSERTHRILELKDLLREQGLNQKQRARLLSELGELYQRANQWQDAIEAYKQSLQAYLELGDRHGEAQTLNNLGIVYNSQGRWSEAIAYYEQSLQIKRELGDRHGEGQILANLGVLYEKQGKLKQALELWQNALTKLHPDSPDTQKVRGWLQEA